MCQEQLEYLRSQALVTRLHLSAQAMLKINPQKVNFQPSKLPDPAHHMLTQALGLAGGKRPHGAGERTFGWRFRATLDETKHDLTMESRSLF